MSKPSSRDSHKTPPADLSLDAAMAMARNHLRISNIHCQPWAGPERVFCLLISSRVLDKALPVRNLLPYVNLDRPIAIETSSSLTAIDDAWRYLESNFRLQSGGRVVIDLPKPTHLSLLANFLTSAWDADVEPENIGSWDDFLARRDWGGADPSAGRDLNGAPIGIFEMKLFECPRPHQIEHLLGSPLVTTADFWTMLLDRLEARVSICNVADAPSLYDKEEVKGPRDIHTFMASLANLSILVGRPNPALWNKVYDNVCAEPDAAPDYEEDAEMMNEGKPQFLRAYLRGIELDGGDVLEPCEVGVIDAVCEFDPQRYTVVLHEGARAGSRAMMTLALTRGADPRAALNGRTAMERLLCDKCSDKDLADARKRLIPLVQAALAQHGAKAALEEIRRSGGTPSVPKRSFAL